MVPAQATAAQTESRAIPFIYSERAKIPPWYEEPNSPALANLNRKIIQSNGRDKAMDLRSQDLVDNVINRLETLSDLFEFYWFARNKTGFSESSIDGLCLIIADCIAELKEAAK